MPGVVLRDGVGSGDLLIQGGEDGSVGDCEDFFDIPAAQHRRVHPRAEHGQSRPWIGDDACLTGGLPVGCEDNSAGLDVGVERIAGANTEPAPEWSWKNDLTFGGDLGLHGKTILPGAGLDRQSAQLAGM